MECHSSYVEDCPFRNASSRLIRNVWLSRMVESAEESWGRIWFSRCCSILREVRAQWVPSRSVWTSLIQASTSWTCT